MECVMGTEREENKILSEHLCEEEQNYNENLPKKKKKLFGMC